MTKNLKKVLNDREWVAIILFIGLILTFVIISKLTHWSGYKKVELGLDDS